MKTVIFFISCFVVSKAIVCPQNACQLVRCASVTAENCNGHIKSGGGYCGCCDSCESYLGEGDNCFSTILLGVPSASQCGPGLHCDAKTFRCKAKITKRVLNPCAQKLSELKATNGQHLLGSHQPVCDDQGYYQPKQCSGSQCYCVSKDGTQLQNFHANIWEAQHQTCQCARDLDDYMKSGLIGKLFFCTPDGSYKTTLNPCAQEKSSLAAQHNGLPLLGAPKPRCDGDGFYLPKQCSGSQCYCVAKDGKHIEGYQANVWEADHMTCQCARDQYEYMQSGLIGRMFYCANDGSYQNYQCIGSVCHCTDSSGNVVQNSKSVSIANIDTLKC